MESAYCRDEATGRCRGKSIIPEVSDSSSTKIAAMICICRQVNVAHPSPVSVLRFFSNGSVYVCNHIFVRDDIQ